MNRVVIVYEDRTTLMTDSVPGRTEFIPQSEVIAWAELNEITLMWLNPQGSGAHRIYAMTPLTPDQEVAVRLRWH